MSYKRNKINKLSNQLNTMYVTSEPFNFNDNYIGYKYFICFYGTNKIYKAFKNQNDLIEELEYIIEYGAQNGGRIFY